MGTPFVFQAGISEVGQTGSGSDAERIADGLALGQGVLGIEPDTVVGDDAFSHGRTSVVAGFTAFRGVVAPEQAVSLLAIVRHALAGKTGRSG